MDEQRRQQIFEDRCHELEQEFAQLGLRLRRLADERRHVKSMMDDIAEELESLQQAGPDGESDIPAEQTAQPDDTTGWRQVQIELLGLPNGLAKILRDDNKITCLGQLADCKDFARLKKIREIKAEQIKDALSKWWADHPEMVPR